MPYTTTWEARGVVWNYSGTLTGNELLQSNLEIFGDERFDDIRYQIIDLTAVNAMEVTRRHMRKIAHLDMAAARTNPRVRVAVVTTSEGGIDMTDIYKQYTVEKSPWHTKIFTTREAAAAWVRQRVQ
jgi:hypothetical protein